MTVFASVHTFQDYLSGVVCLLPIRRPTGFFVVRKEKSRQNPKERPTVMANAYTCKLIIIAVPSRMHRSAWKKWQKKNAARMGMAYDRCIVHSCGH